MPAYVAGQSRVLQQGQMVYLIGADVNPTPSTRQVISTATRTTNVVTVTTAATHNFALGQIVEIQGVTGSTTQSFNGRFTIASIPSGTTFTYSQTGTNDAGGVGGLCDAPTTEAVYANGAATIVCAIGGDPNAPAGRALVWGHRYNTNPTAVTLALEGASMDGDNSNWKGIDSDNTAAGNVKTVPAFTTGTSPVGPFPFRLLRIRCTALTIGSGAGQIAWVQLI